MKKLFFITILLTSFTVFSQDDNHDYKWLVGGSTGGDITLGSPEATGINLFLEYHPTLIQV